MRVILPGDVVGKGKVMPYERGIVREENGVKYALVVGMKLGEKFVALEQVYIPKVGDNIVGIVVGERPPVGYIVDTNTYYQGLILTRQHRIKLPLATQIFAKISRIEPNGAIILDNITRLSPGKIVDVPSSKISRIIGKNASMIKLITEKTGTSIYVGSNGYIWIGKRGNVAKAIKAIKLVVSKAHMKGLTDEVATILEG